MRIGVDVGGTKIEGIALGSQGDILARKRVPTPQGDYAQIITAIRDLVLALETEAGGGAPVGVGIPGTLSPDTGLVKNANTICLVGHPLDKDLADALKRPVRLANDANCFAISEASDGAARDAEVVFGVILGTGCGGGLVVRGNILTGPNAISGEWGHNPLPWPRDDERPGRTCYCGKSGCLETWISGPGFAADYACHENEMRDPETILALARSGDAGARSALKRYTDRLARGLAVVINIIDPDMIVVGGGMSAINELYEELPPLLDEYVFSDTVRTPIVRNVHGASSGVRGAAWLWPET